MAETFTIHNLTFVISGLVLLGAYLGALTLYRSLRNREKKRKHQLPGD